MSSITCSPASVTCFRYESTLVGSYSSKNFRTINKQHNFQTVSVCLCLHVFVFFSAISICGVVVRSLLRHLTDRQTDGRTTSANCCHLASGRRIKTAGKTLIVPTLSLHIADTSDNLPRTILAEVSYTLDIS